MSLKSCVFICTSAVITVFNVNPVVFLNSFLSLSAICFVISDNLFIFYFLNFYELVFSISCLFVFIYRVYTLSY